MKYLSGFNNTFETEALEGVLPVGMSSLYVDGIAVQSEKFFVLID
jgi:hypothetical protein